MKKLLWALMLVFTAVSFASCDEIGKPVDPEDPDKEVCEVCGEDPCVCEDETICPDCGKNPCECEDPNPGTDPLQPSKQKEKLSSVGQKLIDLVPVEEWEKYSQFAEELANSVYVSEDYDWGTVYDWFEDHAEDAYKEDNGKLIINGNKYSNEWITEVVILMSNHTGLFTLADAPARFLALFEGQVLTRATQEHLIQKGVSLAGCVADGFAVGDPGLLPGDDAVFHLVNDAGGDFSVNIHVSCSFSLVGARPLW